MRFKDYQERLEQLENRVLQLEKALETMKTGGRATAPETAPETAPDAGTTGSGKAPEGTDAPEAAKTDQASTAKKASARAKKTNK